jgi:hypothetical protein
MFCVRELSWQVDMSRREKQGLGEGTEASLSRQSSNGSVIRKSPTLIRRCGFVSMLCLLEGSLLLPERLEVVCLHGGKEDHRLQPCWPLHLGDRTQLLIASRCKTTGFARGTRRNAQIQLRLHK